MSDSDISGLTSYRNWHAFTSGAPLQQAYEYPLFTHAHITGEIREGLGPYELLNAVPEPHRRHSRPTLILRVEYCLRDKLESQRLDKTDDKTYHGGYLQDEMAALVSLCLGIPLKSGGVTRVFEGGKDHRGRPVSWSFEDDPTLPQIPRSPVLPKVIGPHSLEDASVISTFPSLSSEDAIGLIRSARQYQDALWIAESDPELAWLMLVSAAETAANRWRSAMESPVERLHASKPDLEKLLEAEGGRELVQKVAPLVAPYMGSTKKFVTFLTTFMPEPPPDRPPEALRISWSKKDMKRNLGDVYDCRSHALHGGIPFPLPMCMPVRMKEEKPVGSMVSSYGVWLAKDTPMLLHVFEYIVRNSLLKWWKSMLSDENSEKSG